MNQSMSTDLLGTVVTADFTTPGGGVQKKSGRISAVWVNPQGYLLALVVADDGTATSNRADYLDYQKDDPMR